MKQQDISKAKSADLRGSVAAMERAAEMARKTAIDTNTAIVVVKDGKPLRILAKELLQRKFSQ